MSSSLCRLNFWLYSLVSDLAGKYLDKEGFMHGVKSRCVIVAFTELLLLSISNYSVFCSLVECRKRCFLCYDDTIMYWDSVGT